MGDPAGEDYKKKLKAFKNDPRFMDLNDKDKEEKLRMFYSKYVESNAGKQDNVDSFLTSHLDNFKPVKKKEPTVLPSEDTELLSETQSPSPEQVNLTPEPVTPVVQEDAALDPKKKTIPGGLKPITGIESYASQPSESTAITLPQQEEEFKPESAPVMNELIKGNIDKKVRQSDDRDFDPSGQSNVSSIDFLRNQNSTYDNRHLDYQYLDAVERNKNDEDALGMLQARSTSDFYDAATSKLNKDGDIDESVIRGEKAESIQTRINDLTSHLEIISKGQPVKGVTSDAEMREYKDKIRAKIEVEKGLLREENEYGEGAIHESMLDNFFPEITSQTNFEGGRIDGDKTLKSGSITAYDAKIFSDYSKFKKSEEENPEELFSSDPVQFSIDAVKHQTKVLETSKKREVDAANALLAEGPARDARLKEIDNKYKSYSLINEIGAERLIKRNLTQSGQSVEELEKVWAKEFLQQAQQSYTDERHAKWKSGEMGYIDGFNYFVDQNIAKKVKKTASGVLGGIATLPRTLGVGDDAKGNLAEAGLLLKTIEDFADEKLSVESFNTDTPTDLKHTFREDGSINWGSAVDQATQSAFDMLSYISGASLASKSSKLSKVLGSSTRAQKFGMVGSSWITQHSENYREAIDNGLDESEAMKYTWAATSIQSMLELVNPNLNILKKGAVSKSMLTKMKKGASVKDALKESWKGITKELPAEVVQETLQGLSEAGVNKVTNDIIGRKAFDDEFTAKDFAETALITILTTGGVATPGGIKTRNRLNDAAYKKAVEDIPGITIKAADLFQKGKMDEKQFTELVDGIKKAKEIYDGMPEKLSNDAKIELFTLVNEKREVMENAEKGIVDPSLKPMKDEETKSKTDVIDKEIEQVLAKNDSKDAPTIEEVKPTEEVSTSKPEVKNRITNEYASSEVDRVKNLEKEAEDGATMNLDGSKYDGGGLVVPLASKNMKSSELTTDAINDFIEENAGSISRDNVKVGVYKFPDSDQVSIDLNIVADPSMKDQALSIGKELGQESLFDLDTFENIKTGADGKNPKKLNPKELIDIQNKLSKDPKSTKVKEESAAQVKDAQSKIDKVLGKKTETKEESSTKPKEGYTRIDKDTEVFEIEELKSSAKTEDAKKALGTASNIVKALNSIGGKDAAASSVMVHHTEASYEKAVVENGGTKEDAESSGFYEDVNGEIHMSPELVKSNTLLHEASHKVMASYLKKNPKAVEEFFETLKKTLPAASVKKLKEFASQYGDADSKTYKDEFVTEALADIANGDISLSGSNLSKVKNFIESILEVLGFKPKDIKLTGKEDVKEYARKLSKAFSTGAEISIKDGVISNVEIEVKDGDGSKNIQLSKVLRDAVKSRLPVHENTKVTKDFDLKKLNGTNVSSTLSDRLYAGRIGAHTVLGGIGYPEATGRFWAAGKINSANKIVNESKVAPDGYRYLLPAIMSDISHMSNRDATMISLDLLREASSNKEMTKTSLTADIKKAFKVKGLSKYRTGVIKAITGVDGVDGVINGLESFMLSKEFDNFEKRRVALKALIGDGNINHKYESIESFSKVAEALSEPIAEEAGLHGVVSVIRTKGDIKVVKTDSKDEFHHDSYPFSIQSNAEVEVLYLNKPHNLVDIIPEFINSDGKKVSLENELKTKTGTKKGKSDWTESGIRTNLGRTHGLASYSAKLQVADDKDLDAGGINKDMTVDGVDKKPQFQKKRKAKKGVDLIDQFGKTEAQGEMNKSMMKDSDGNYLFYHYSPKEFKGKKIDPRHFGKNPITTDRRMHGISFYYTNPKDREGMVGSDAKVKVVKIAPHKVYPFNTDPLNFYDKAKKQFRKDFGQDQAFSPDMQASYIGKVAKDNGFEMIVAVWGGKVQTKKSLRGESQTPLKFVEGNPKDAVKASKAKSKTKEKSKKNIEKTVESLKKKSKPDFQRSNVNQKNNTPEAKSKRKGVFGSIIGAYGNVVGAKSKIEEATFGRLFEKFEDALAKQATKSLNSSYSAVRKASKLVTTFYNGIPRSIDELTKARELSGERAWSIQESKNLLDALYDVVGGDNASLAIVDKVMDPMFHLEQEVKAKYDSLKDVDLLSREDVELALGEEIDDYDSYIEQLKVENDMTIDSLNEEERNLYDLIRNINDMTHAMNHQMGLISDDVYEKHKGTYSGREYDFTENLPEDYQEALREQNAHVNKMREEIYKRRKDVTDKMKDAKIEDPAFTAIKRYLQTKQNAAVYQYGEYIASLGDKHVSKEEKPGFKKMPEKGYGSLSGMWVTQHIAEDMVGYYFTGSIMKGFYEAAKAYDKFGVRQFFKKKLTVYNPKVIMGNYLSNLGFASAAGISPVLMLKNAHKAHKQLSRKETGSLFERLTRAGILGTDVISGDLTSGTKTTKDGKVKSSKIKDIDDSVKKFYGYGDDLAKMTAYVTLVEDMGYSHDDATKKVYNSFQNYQTVGKIWDLSAKFPVIGSAFIKFQADLQRIMYNKLKSPISALTFGLGLRAIVKGLSDDTEEEWEIRSKMRFTPKIFGMPLEVKRGSTTVDLSRFLTPYYGFDTGESGSWIDVVMENLPFTTEKMTDDKGRETSSSLFSRGDPLAGPIVDALLLNRDFRGKTINKEETGIGEGEKMLNSANFLARQYVPTYHIANDLYTTTDRREDFYGRIRDPKDVLTSLFIRVKELPSGWKKKTLDSELFSLNMTVLKSKNGVKGVKDNYKKLERRYKNNLDEGQISKKEYDEKVNTIREKAIKDLVRWEVQGRKDSKKVEEFINKWSKILHEDE